VLRECVELLERNHLYRTTCLGEPQLGRRSLYPTLGTSDSQAQVSDLLDLLAYADGTRDLIGISDTICAPVRRLYPLVERLVEAGLLAEDPA
jgi:aminopeptidase-like protein